MLFLAVFAAPVVGDEAATPAAAKAPPLLGADSATWAPAVPAKRSGLLGEDSATWAPLPAATAGCDAITAKDACDKNDKCSWCLSGAVPPACKTLDEAKQLPPAVFQCDKLS